MTEKKPVTETPKPNVAPTPPAEKALLGEDELDVIAGGRAPRNSGNFLVN